MTGSVGSGHRISRRNLLAGGAGAVAAATLPAGAATAADDGPRLGAAHASIWVRTLYDVVMAEGLTPPNAARVYYYATLAMYEAALPGSDVLQTMAGQLPGLARGPRPGGQVDPPTALAVALVTVVKGLLPAAKATSVALLDNRLAEVVALRTGDAPRRQVTQAMTFGQAVASHLLTWMRTDGYAVASTTPYTPPVGPDKWRSTPPNFGTAIEPYWHLVRPAALTTADEVVPAPHIPFSADPGSPFRAQAMATYEQSFVNTPDQVAIARFWTDNPVFSGLPAGHWLLLVSQLAQEPLRLRLDRTLEVMLRLGAALHDAFVNCWTWKYRFNLIRPVTYIRDHVDPAWNTLVNTPQFPEYTSGHSVGSGAADVVLTRLLGVFPFVDSTGVSRNLAPRSFASITAAAEEAAMSRLFGGIHYPMAITNGLAQGRTLGQLHLRRLRTRA